MLSVAICEDQLDKLNEVREVLQQDLGISGDSIAVYTHAKAARESFKRDQYDIVILDVNMPPDANRTAKPGVGLELLMQICNSARYNRPHCVIFLSEFADQLSQVKGSPGANFWNAILYQRNSDAWRGELHRQLEYILSARARAEQAFDYDCVFITALDAPEFEAFEAMEVGWKVRQDLPFRALMCQLPGRGDRRLRFAVVAAPQMGCTATSVLAYQALHEFKPRCIIMCGITAGIASECDVGDILVADPCWEWGSGKYIERGRKSHFLPAPTQLRASPEILTKLRDKKYVRGIARRVFDQWPAEKPPAAPEIRIGPMVSGAAVIASSAMVRVIRKQHRKLIGIEMETYGLYYASARASAGAVQYVSLKAVCDFADRHKKDKSQKYAAFVSARFGFEFAKDLSLGAD